MRKNTQNNTKIVSTDENSVSPVVSNSLEVISNGKLVAIARPSVSRSSSRPSSQFSSASFELETLPDDKELYDRYFQRNDLMIEDANAQDESFKSSSVEKRDDSSSMGRIMFKENLIQENNEMDKKEFEQNIKSISKRILRGKKVLLQTEIGTDINGEDSLSTDNSCKNDKDPVDLNSAATTPLMQVQEEDEPQDPKIKKGLEKIKKLDTLLAEKMKLEKEVKADRKRMEKEWEIELKGFMEWCADHKTKPGVQEFLALTGGFADSKDHDNDVSGHYSPFFPTEIETDSTLERESCNSSDKNNTLGTDDNSNSETSHERGCNGKTDKREQAKIDKRSGKNFLKRNKELAGHAKDVIPLTDAERSRLDELLADSNDILMVENPFSKNQAIISAYELDDDSKKAMLDIDEKLKTYTTLNDSECISINSAFEQEALSNMSLDFSETTTNKDDHTECKEPYLLEGKEFRDMHNRLKKIESELSKIKLLNEQDFWPETPRISNEVLRQLLDVDDRLTSSALSVLESHDDSTSQRTVSRTTSSYQEPHLDYIEEGIP